MSESHVYGFLIQEIRDVRLTSYNSGNGVLGEAAINRVDIEFTLTTELPHFAPRFMFGFRLGKG